MNAWNLYRAALLASYRQKASYSARHNRHVCVSSLSLGHGEVTRSATSGLRRSSERAGSSQWAFLSPVERAESGRWLFESVLALGAKDYA